MGGILDHLRAEHQRALRAEADADRLAEEFAQRTHCICDLHLDTACVHCVVLNLHDKEVEAR